MKEIYKLEENLKKLEKNKIEIEEKISSIKKKLIILKNSNKFSKLKTNEKNRDLFAYYLSENKNLSDRTVHRYFHALQVIKDLFFQIKQISIPTEIYFIDDIKIVILLIDMFQETKMMVDENKKRHYELSAAINNYYDFLITITKIQ